MRFIPPAGLISWPPVETWTEKEWSCWLTQHAWTPAQIAQYLDHDRFAYGVGLTPTGEKARPHNAYEVGVRWLYKPTPKGVSLHATRTGRASNILWGGSAGGSKSMSARWEAIDMCLFPARDDVRVIIARRELEELRRTHLDKIDGEARRICNALGNPKAVKVTTQPPVATFEVTPGVVAKCLMAHALNDGDEEKYLSEDYDLYIGDEATWLLWKQIVGFQGRLRNDPKMNRQARMILTTNPGGVAAPPGSKYLSTHDECVRHFITKTVSRDENPKYDPDDYLFIRASLYDNPHYMDSDGSYDTYEKRLSMYEPHRRRQLLDGDWGAIVGQFFQEFDPFVHVHDFESVA